MGQPAARAGDLTAHGGAITVGAPTVFIGGMPAARMGDMHACPMVTPGTPPVPHVGGTIIKGSTGVNICGMPAARIGDMATCVGPPDTIAVGCPTVNIGETKPGGGGGAGAAQTAAAAAASVSAAAAGNAPQLTGDHFLHVEFKDSAGLPVTFGNYTLTHPGNETEEGGLPTRIKRTGVPEGQYTIALKAITSARWSVREARDDDTVQCIVETVGIEDGTPVVLQIYMKNLNSPDMVVLTVENLTINGGDLSYEWQPWFFSESECAENLPNGFVVPSFFFKVIVGGMAERSGVLGFRDFIEIELLDQDDKPVPDADYRVTLSSGEVRNGKTDSCGYANISGVPPYAGVVRFPDVNEALILQIDSSP